MKALSGKEMVKILEDHGWLIARIHGSHHVMVKEGSDIRLSVPVHANKTLKKGLQNAILKQANIKID